MIEKRYQQWRQELPEQNFQEIHAQVFSSLLKLRYHEVPDWAMQKIAQAEISTIDHWLEKLMDVDDIEDLITPD